MEEIRVPEEEIITAMKAVLATELQDLIEKMNNEKQEEWLLPFKTIDTDKNRMANIIDSSRKPADRKKTSLTVLIKFS